MFKSLKVFRLLGVDVKIHWSWLLMFFIVIDFKDSVGEMLFSSLFVILLFTFILIHEFGHILAARKYGVTTSQVNLNLLGGVALMDGGLEGGLDGLTPKQSLWVTFAGPLTNLVMFIMLLPFISLVLGDVVDVKLLNGLQELYFLALISNIILFVFNMLPIFPMDGGRLLRSTLELYEVKNHLIISIRVTQIFCLLLVGFGVLISGYLMIIIGVLFFVLSFIELRNNRNEEFLKNHKPNDNSDIDGLIDEIIDELKKK